MKPANLHLKMDGWNTRTFPFGMAYFQVRTVGFMECTFLGVTSVVNLCLIWLSLCAILLPPNAQVPETGRLCLTFSCDWHFNEDFWNFRRAIHLMLGEDHFCESKKILRVVAAFGR